MVTASARANIALVKYWGKRDTALNIPAAGSLSLTLQALETKTSVTLGQEKDQLRLDGRPASEKATARITRFLDLLRNQTGRREHALVVSENNFPTAAGLASSASAFAALSKASCAAFEIEMSDRALSVLARQGSGSAARSIFGGFCRMHAGQLEDGTDAYAEAFEGSQIQLSAVIACTDAEEKEVGSTEGMERTKETSPYHDSWLKQVDLDLEQASEALRSGDMEQLSAVVEGSCLSMHANAMAARPGLIYFKPVTLWAIERVRSLRKAGVPVCFSIDAGPHLVAFCPLEAQSRVATELGQHPDVRQVLKSEPGDGAKIEGDA